MESLEVERFEVERQFIQFGYSSNKYVEHAHQSVGIGNISMNKSGKKNLISWSLHFSIWK